MMAPGVSLMDGVRHLLYLEKPAEFARLAINFVEANQVAETRPEVQIGAIDAKVQFRSAHTPCERRGEDR